MNRVYRLNRSCGYSRSSTARSFNEAMLYKLCPHIEQHSVGQQLPKREQLDYILIIQKLTK